MSDHAPSLDAAAIKRAVRVLEQHRLTVLEQDWQSGGHRLTIVATPGAGILAAAEVRSAATAVPGGCLTALSAGRVTAAVEALRVWNREHGGAFDELWFIIVTLHPRGAVQAVAAGDGEAV